MLPPRTESIKNQFIVSADSHMVHQKRVEAPWYIANVMGSAANVVARAYVLR